MLAKQMRRIRLCKLQAKSASREILGRQILECAGIAKRRRRFGLPDLSGSYLKRCRATLATALHMLSPAPRAQKQFVALILGAHAPGFMLASAPRTNAYSTIER